jgi:hypothetical protein
MLKITAHTPRGVFERRVYVENSAEEEFEKIQHLLRRGPVFYKFKDVLLSGDIIKETVFEIEEVDT